MRPARQSSEHYGSSLSLAAANPVRNNGRSARPSQLLDLKSIVPKTGWLWLLAGVASLGTPARCARAQTSLPGVLLSRSISGQFVVLSTPAAVRSPMASALENDTNFVRLAPTLLPVSCERIKQLLSHQLNTTSPWRGKIFLRLYPTASV